MIQGELTIGQLVAAELVLSVVFYGISQLGTYMTYFYDLCAAVEELSLFHEIEQEEFTGSEDQLDGDSSLAFVRARGETRGNDITLDFSLPARARVLACTEDHSLQRLFTNFMKRHDVPASGYITVGGHDTKSLQAYALRREIIVLDRPTVLEMTIREYLKLSAPDVKGKDILDALRVVDLHATIAQFKQSLDTPMAVTGWPLSMTETLRLRLAAALIARPRILVLGPLYDVMPLDTLASAIDHLQRDHDCSVIHFSLRHDDSNYNQFLYLGQEQQAVFESFNEFCAHIKRQDVDSPSLPDVETPVEGAR